MKYEAWRMMKWQCFWPRLLVTNQNYFIGWLKNRSAANCRSTVFQFADPSFAWSPRNFRLRVKYPHLCVGAFFCKSLNVSFFGGELKGLVLQLRKVPFAFLDLQRRRTRRRRNSNVSIQIELKKNPACSFIGS